MPLRLSALVAACVAAALLIQAAPSSAADKQWSAYGGLPGDAPVFGLAIDPAQAATVYAATMGAGLLRTDDGKTWRDVAADLPRRIWKVAIDASRSSDGYAPIYIGSSGHGFFKSTDGGRGWKALSNGLGNTKALNVRAIALGRNQLTIGTSDGVYRTTDGGQNWQAAGMQGQDISTVAYAAYGSSGNPAVVIAGVDGVQHGDSRLLLTKDNGVTWTPIKQGIPTDMVVTAVAAGPVPSNADNLHPARPVFVAGSAGVFKSDDGGQTYAQVAGLPQQGFGGLSLSPGDPNIVYASSDGTLSTPGGVWRTTDRGATWTALSAGLADHGVTATVLSRGSPATVVAATYSPATPSVTVWSLTDSQAAPAAAAEDPLCPEPSCASGPPLIAPALVGKPVTTALVNGTLVCGSPASPSASPASSSPAPAGSPSPSPTAAPSPCPTPVTPPVGSSGGGFPIVPIAVVVGLVLAGLVYRALTARQ